MADREWEDQAQNVTISDIRLVADSQRPDHVFIHWTEKRLGEAPEGCYIRGDIYDRNHNHVANGLYDPGIGKTKNSIPASVFALGGTVELRQCKPTDGFVAAGFCTLPQITVNSVHLEHSDDRTYVCWSDLCVCDVPLEDLTYEAVWLQDQYQEWVVVEQDGVGLYNQQVTWNALAHGEVGTRRIPLVSTPVGDQPLVVKIWTPVREDPHLVEILPR